MPRRSRCQRPACDQETAAFRFHGHYENVADISRRADIGPKAAERYAEALATMDDKMPLKELTQTICRPAVWIGRRALQPLDPDDAKLLEAVSRGEFVLDGFRNRDLRALLYGQASPSKDEDRRRAAAVTRIIRLLHAHSLSQKVPKSHRYQLTPLGRTTIAALLAARDANTAKLTQAA